MAEFLLHVEALRPTTLLAMALLAGSGAYIVNIFSDSRFMTVLFGAAFLLGALASEFVFSGRGIVVHDDPDANLLLISMIGMTVSLLAITLLFKTYDALTRTKPKAGA